MRIGKLKIFNLIDTDAGSHGLESELMSRL
jgi:hypothetical protein